MSTSERPKGLAGILAMAEAIRQSWEHGLTWRLRMARS